MFSRISMLHIIAIAIIGFECAPLEAEKKTAQVTHYEFEHLPNDAYRFKYETSDGQTREEYGYFKQLDNGLVLVISGSYSYIGDDGKEYHVRYTSDENGFKASGAHLPNTGTDVIDEVPALGGPPLLGLSPSLIATLAG